MRDELASEAVGAEPEAGPQQNEALHCTLAMRRGCSRDLRIDTASSSTCTTEGSINADVDISSSSYDTDAHDAESVDFEDPTNSIMDSADATGAQMMSDETSEELGFAAIFADEPTSARRQQNYDDVKRKVSFGSSESVLLLGDVKPEQPQQLPLQPQDGMHCQGSVAGEESNSSSDNDDDIEDEDHAHVVDAFAGGAALAGNRSSFASPRTMQERLRRRKGSISIFATNFITLASIGSGSFGDVFCCRCRADGRRYALKKARQRFRGHRERASMLREYDVGVSLALATADPKNDAAGSSQVSAEAARRIPHPHLVAYYSAWQEDGFIHIQVSPHLGLRAHKNKLCPPCFSLQPFSKILFSHPGRSVLFAPF